MSPPHTQRAPRAKDASGFDAPEEAVTRLRLGIARLARRLRQEADTGLSPSQLSCLATIERDGPLSLRSLADRERVAAPTITGIVARLEDEGLVARTGDPTDRRAKIVTISDQGRQKVATVRRRKDEWLRRHLDQLGADEARRLLDAAEIMERLASQAGPDSHPDSNPDDNADRSTGGAGR